MSGFGGKKKSSNVVYTSFYRKVFVWQDTFFNTNKHTQDLFSQTDMLLHPPNLVVFK